MADRTIANPKRGCGHLKHGKGYVRGVIGSPDGVLPSFVELRPYVPFKEIGTDGGFTRGFLRFDGTQTQIATEGDLCRYNPLYPARSTDEQAQENHVKAGVYDTVEHVPDQQWRRHVDRLHHTGTDADHRGEEPLTGTGQDVHADLLMRVGATHYDTPDDFIQEAVRLGISKAIPLSQRQEPPEIVPGQTRMWLVHPDACEDGWGVIGYAYLQEVVYTEPVDGNVPQWVQDCQQRGDLDVVEIEDPGPANSSTLDDWEDGNGPDGDPQVQADNGQTEAPVPARPVERQQNVDDWSNDDEAGSDGSDPHPSDGEDGGADLLDGSDPVTDDEPGPEPDPGSTPVPADGDTDRDVQSLRSALDDVSYNDLKAAAADADADVGQSPAKDDLINGLLQDADTGDLRALVNGA